MPVPFRGPGASNRSRCGTEPISMRNWTDLGGYDRTRREGPAGEGPARRARTSSSSPCSACGLVPACLRFTAPGD